MRAREINAVRESLEDVYSVEDEDEARQVKGAYVYPSMLAFARARRQAGVS